MVSLNIDSSIFTHNILYFEFVVNITKEAPVTGEICGYLEVIKIIVSCVVKFLILVFRDLP